eukprot:TRINITY_DN18558_c1_g3_i1.p2 TRINITY_DN18558_c1_g3~~TRINITY_DN18558_c1_g3_i1.p2  ORF type:complete len:510 (-),score=72.32 TRINITY_DN18558_c1_g3_i1:2122-3651(-)
MADRSRSLGAHPRRARQGVHHAVPMLSDQYQAVRGRLLQDINAMPIPSQDAQDDLGVQGPPGLARPSNSATALAELTKVLKSVSDQLAIQNIDKANIPGSAQNAKKYFNSIPEQLQKTLKKRLHDLDALIKKFFRAKRAVQKSEKGAIHPMAKAVLAKQWQVSREELAAFASDPQLYNAKIEWEKLCKKHSEEINKFAQNVAKAQVNIYTKLTGVENFLKVTDNEVTAFIKSCPNAFSTTSSREALKHAVTQWTYHVHIDAWMYHEDQAAKKAKEKEKYEQKLAKAQASMDLMSQEELTLHALLDLAKYTKKVEAEDPPSISVSAEPSKQKAFVPKSSALGSLLSKHETLRNAFNIDVKADMPATSSRRRSQSNDKNKTKNKTKRSNSNSNRNTKANKPKSTSAKRNRSTSANKGQAQGQARGRSAERTNSQNRIGKTPSARRSQSARSSQASARRRSASGSSRSSWKTRSSMRSSSKGTGSSRSEKVRFGNKGGGRVFRFTPHQSPRR